jgi:hypothetical protein
VKKAPFRLSYGAVAQAPGTTAGPGGRMSYRLADGSTHRLTDLTGSRRTRSGVTYTVATVGWSSSSAHATGALM